MCLIQNIWWTGGHSNISCHCNDNEFVNLHFDFVRYNTNQVAVASAGPPSAAWHHLSGHLCVIVAICTAPFHAAIRLVWAGSTVYRRGGCGCITTATRTNIARGWEGGNLRQI